MSSKSRTEPGSQHVFFHAMVLMGSSIAAGCGGSTTDGTSDDTTPGSGGDGGSGNHSGSGGTVMNTGGTSSSGGVFHTGGTGGVMYTGGTGSGGSVPATGGTSHFIDAGNPACPPSQWDCSSNPPECGYDGSGWALPEGCTCNFSRPQTAADCAPSESFVCRAATHTSDGTPLDAAVPLSCSCLPRQDDCWTACDTISMGYAPGWGAQCADSATDGSYYLCGCAYVILL